MTTLNQTVHAYKVRGKIKPWAHFCKTGNIKLGTRVWTFSTLNRDDSYIITDADYNTYTINGTCAHYCNGCKIACYVNKSYRYTSVIKCHAENTIAIRSDLHLAFLQLRLQIDHARIKPSQIRFNQSGEIISKEMFQEIQSLARDYPYIKLWLYTKAYDLIVDDIANTPDNMTVNYSVWHESGINEFRTLRKLSPRVACFAYCDGFKYPDDIAPRVMCPAYDENGKIDHSKTCDKCGLCMIGKGLQIGCYDH